MESQLVFIDACCACGESVVIKTLFRKDGSQRSWVSDHNHVGAIVRASGATIAEDAVGEATIDDETFDEWAERYGIEDKVAAIREGETERKKGNE